MKASIVASVLLTVALGCAPTRMSPARAAAPAARSAALDEMLRSDLAADHAFPWSSTRRLVWNDFQGTPATGGTEGAVTAYGLFYAWKCLGQAFEFRVVAAFRRRQSWVKEAVLRDTTESRRTLAHEQTHFDLTELHARRMRRYFADLPDACRKADGDLHELAQRLVREEKVEQRRYDAETNHGLRLRPQAMWSADVARPLAAPSR
jgi:hypothetical protein